MPEETEGHAFEQGRPLTRPRTRHRFGEGRVHGFGIVADDADARNAVTVGACCALLTPGHLFEIGMLGEKVVRSEEHTSNLQSLMRISYDVFSMQNKKTQYYTD